jgi:lysine-N-methylase
MACDTPGLSTKLKQYIKSNPVPTDRNTASILLQKEGGSCPFLSGGWCEIQNTLGEEWLSNVCAAYPRQHVKLGDELFQSMSLSCPEAARLALLDRDAFDFEAPVLKIRQEDVLNVSSPWNLSLDQMQQLHTFSIQIVRTSGLKLWERLVCLGLFCENLGVYFRSNQFEGVESVLTGIESLICSGQVSEVTQLFEASYGIQSTFFRSLWLLGRNPLANQYQLSLQNIVDRAVLIDEHLSDDIAQKLADQYELGLKKLDHLLQDDHPFLEHAVLNDMLQDLFPFSGAEPMHNFFKLITRFGFLRWILANVCFELGDQANLEDLVQSAQQFYRKFRHNPLFANALHESLNKAGWATLEKAMPILKV